MKFLLQYCFILMTMTFISCSYFTVQSTDSLNEKKLVVDQNQQDKSDSNSTDKSKDKPSEKISYKPAIVDVLAPRGLDFANAPSVIAFGSCANQDASQPLWNTILKNNPDLFVFMGDNVYASKPETQPIAAQYTKLNKILEFRNFREKVPFLVTWDDHDYGQNDAGKENPMKEEAKKEFLSQWPYVKDSLKMKQGGVYHSKILGGVKKKSPTVQFILLDTRWYRSALTPANDPSNPSKRYVPTTDKNATILGSEQWNWLEKQLSKPTNIKIIVSSIQFIANDHGFEKWGNFPAEKERMIQLIKNSRAKNVFFISGDRHRGSIAKMDIKGYGPLFDFTASSINKPIETDESDSSYIGSAYKKENFGLATINWAHKRITFEIRDMENKTVNKIETSLK